jgi:hypothetical protein
LRNITDTLRRGLDNMLANWPLIAIRIAESFLFILIVIGSVVAAIIPIAVAAGLSSFDSITNANNPGDAIAALLIEHWGLILYILAIITILLVVLVAIHSFVEAGNARIFVDAEHKAPKTMPVQREAYRVFSMDRWINGGRMSWWAVFWIYNAAWSVACLILLVPLLLTIVAMLLTQENSARVAFGCGGIAVAIIIAIPITVIVAIWTQKAIAVCVARASPAGTALKEAWKGILADFGRHFAVAFILFVISFGGAMAISMFTMPMSFLQGAAGHGSPFIGLAFAPARILTSFLQSIFSSAVGLWFLASFVGLTEER